MDSDRPARTTTGRIFISYRREGSAGDARALAHDLMGVFGPESVFLDIAQPGGTTWPDRLRGELASAPVVLALIGPGWLTSADEWNRRRIDSPADWVRQEIAEALGDRHKLLIPILLDGATLPPKQALPDVLAELVDRQARTLDHAMWRWQLGAVVDDIERHTHWSRSDGAGSETPFDAALAQFARAQLRRVETIPLIDGLAPGTGRWTAPGSVTEPVVPDLLPFQIQPPATDRVTIDVAEHLRRASKDRARYSAQEMLSRVEPHRVVIVGGPGSGKTTLLSMMTRAHAQASLAGTTTKTPVLLRVRDLSANGGDSLTAEIAKSADQWLELKLSRDFFDELFASGRGLLLVDGIDEAPSVYRRNELLAKIGVFADRYPSATVVVSSRIVGYDPRLLGRNFEHYELAPFSESQAREVLTNALHAQPDPVAAGVPSDLGLDTLARRIVQDQRFSTLAETPLLLSILARIVVAGSTVDRLPRDRRSLYDTAVEMMLSDWDSQRGIHTAEQPSQLGRGEIRRAMETVAYRLHAGLVQRGSTSIIEATALEHELTTALEQSRTADAHQARWQARDLLRYAVVRAGVLVESGPGQFAFCHRAIQEYLAACAISAESRDDSGPDPIVRHFAEYGLHTTEWRNVNLLLVSMQRGQRAGDIIRHVLDAGSPCEEWLHRDLLFAGEAIGESPSLVHSIDDDLATHAVRTTLEVFMAGREEAGYRTAQRARRVLLAWRGTPMMDIARRCLDDSPVNWPPAGRYCAELLVGNTELAREALVDIIVGDDHEADVAAMAVRNLDVDLECTPEHLQAMLDSIPRRARSREADDPDYRLVFTVAEVVALLAKDGPAREHVRRTYLTWITDETNPAPLRGAAATGLGWLGANSAEIRECLIRMLLDRRIDAGYRSWPAYALYRLAGGEPDAVEAMLTILEDDSPILCGWAQGYLRNFATRSSDVVARLRTLAGDPHRPTLPWVLTASAWLSGLTRTEVRQLESIAASDVSMARRAAAIETLVDYAELTPQWRRDTAERLIATLAGYVGREPNEDDDDAVSAGMQALGRLRVSSPDAWDLCLRFMRHESTNMRMCATYGIGGLPADEQVCAKVVEILNTPDGVGDIRGGLVDALDRILTSDQPSLW